MNKVIKKKTKVRDHKGRVRVRVLRLWTVV